MHDWTFRRQEDGNGNHSDSRTKQKITTLQNSTERSYSYMENRQLLAQYAEDSIERYNQPGSGTAHVNKNNKYFGDKVEDEKTRESRRAREGEE
eukprot:6673942-Heterocapsa_arctica.AAC.1